MSDLISRQNAIKGVKELFACADIGNDECDITYMLENLPSADRPTGEWIEVDSFESEKHSVTDMRCSLCGKYASMVLPHRTRCVYDFCPNCGAKMGGAGDHDYSHHPQKNIYSDDWRKLP